MPCRLFLAFCLCLGACAIMMTRELPGREALIVLGIFSTPFCFKNALRPLGFFLLGFCWAGWQGHSVVDNRVPERFLGQDLTLSVIVHDLVKREPNRAVFDVIIEESPSKFARSISEKKIRLSWYGDNPKMAMGERWRLVVRLKRPRGYRNKTHFDYERYLFAKRISAKGYVLKGQRLESKGALTPAGRQIFWPFISVLNRYSAVLGHGSMIRALGVGDRSEISTAQWSLLRRVGLSHLVAISGLHIGLAALWMSAPAALALRALPQFTTVIPRILIAALVGVGIAYTYAAEAGFPVSALRAYLMAAAALTAMALLRRIRLETILAACMVLMMVLDPLVVSLPGFWLSVSAVWLISQALQYRQKPMKGDSTFPQHRSFRLLKKVHVGFIDLTRVQLFLFLGLIPILAFYGFSIPIAAPLVNLAAVPIFTLLIIPLIFLAVFGGSLIGDHGIRLVLEAADFLIGVVLGAARWVANFEGALIAPSMFLACMSLVGVALWALVYFRDKKLTLVLALISIVWFSLSERGESTLAPGEFSITTFDVGQGLAVLIQTSGHSVLYDTGPQFSDFAPVVEPLRYSLRSQGKNLLDVLIASHGAQDHFGAGVRVMKEFKPREFFSGEPQRTGGRHCTPDLNWTFDRVSFVFIQPEAGDRVSANNRSCVLLVSGPYGTALFTGDIERQMEYRLLRRSRALLEVDVLQIPHHGSKTSSARDFLAATRPQIGLLSRGTKNRFGHPHEDVLGRYAALETRVLDTGRVGRINLVSRVSGWEVKHFGETSQRFYHSIP